MMWQHTPPGFADTGDPDKDEAILQQQPFEFSQRHTPPDLLEIASSLPGTADDLLSPIPVTPVTPIYPAAHAPTVVVPEASPPILFSDEDDSAPVIQKTSTADTAVTNLSSATEGIKDSSMDEGIKVPQAPGKASCLKLPIPEAKKSSVASWGSAMSFKERLSASRQSTKDPAKDRASGRKSFMNNAKDRDVENRMSRHSAKSHTRDISHMISVDSDEFEDFSMISKFHYYRIRVWIFLEEPWDTFLSATVHSAMVIAIVSSILHRISTLGGDQRNTGDCECTKWVGWDIVFTSIFVVDTLIRFLVFPIPRRFLSEPKNAIDTLSLLPFFLASLLRSRSQSGLDEISEWLCAFEAFLRLLRLSRFFSGWQLLFHAIVTSAKALVIPMLFLILIVMFGSCSLFMCEILHARTETWGSDLARHQRIENSLTTILNLPDAIHFSVICILSIGTGPFYDFQAVSVSGQVTVIAMMIFGMLFMAMPIAIVGACFSQTWFDQDRILLLYKVRCRLQAQGFSPEDLYMVFVEIDEDGSGEVEFPEFQAMIKTFNLPSMNTSKMRRLFAYFDHDCDGVINFVDFANTLFPDINWEDVDMPARIKSNMPRHEERRQSLHLERRKSFHEERRKSLHEERRKSVSLQREQNKPETSESLAEYRGSMDPQGVGSTADQLTATLGKGNETVDDPREGTPGHAQTSAQHKDGKNLQFQTQNWRHPSTGSKGGSIISEDLADDEFFDHERVSSVAPLRLDEHRQSDEFDTFHMHHDHSYTSFRGASSNSTFSRSSEGDLSHVEYHGGDCQFRALEHHLDKRFDQLINLIINKTRVSGLGGPQGSSRTSKPQSVNHQFNPPTQKDIPLAPLAPFRAIKNVVKSMPASRRGSTIGDHHAGQSNFMKSIARSAGHSTAQSAANSRRTSNVLGHHVHDRLDRKSLHEKLQKMGQKTSMNEDHT